VDDGWWWVDDGWMMGGGGWRCDTYTDGKQVKVKKRWEKKRDTE